jgi:hypothetical protein
MGARERCPSLTLRVLLRELGEDFFGDGDGGEGGGGDGAADGGELGVGDGFVVDEEVDFVGEGFFADAGEAEVEGDEVFEASGGEEFAGGGDAGPGDVGVGAGVSLAGAREGLADATGSVLRVDGEAKGAEEGVLDFFDPAEVVGEVDDAGHVGFGELDEVGGGEGGHVGRINAGRET